MEIKNSNRLQSYFLLQKKNLFFVAVTGILYNVGMTAGPYFEGRLAQCLYEIMKGRKIWENMLFLAGIYVTVILVVQGARALKRFYVRRFANETSRNMRHMLYNSIIHTEKTQLDKEQLGSVMTKAVSDVDACVEGMRKFTTELFDTGVVMVAYAVMLCVYDVRLAVLSCLTIPCAYLIARKCKGMVSHYNEIYKQNSGRLNQSTMDLVQNVLTCRTVGVAKQRAFAYEKNLTDYEQSAVRANVWESAMQPLYYAIAMTGAVMIFYFGGKNVMGTGWNIWDIGAFTTFFSCFTKLALKSSKAAKLFNAVQKASVSWKRIQPMFREYISTEEGQPEEVDTLSFQDVSVQYQGQKPLAEHISFQAHRGQIIGITGAVACGKSSIGKLFTGEAGYRGQIQINGKELCKMPRRDLCQLLGYMGHEPELMSDTIAENICLGRSTQTMEAALRCVCLDREVKSMPDCENTMVGGNGMRLSGGQQARLALARCLTQKKSLLILDDPFSAVDKETEETIFQNLRSYSSDKITLLMSHRLTLFPQMDGILYLHDQTADFGTHELLMQSQPGYAKLYELQENMESINRYGTLGGEEHA